MDISADDLSDEEEKEEANLNEKDKALRESRLKAGIEMYENCEQLNQVDDDLLFCQNDEEDQLPIEPTGESIINNTEPIVDCSKMKYLLVDGIPITRKIPRKVVRELLCLPTEQRLFDQVNTMLTHSNTKGFFDPKNQEVTNIQSVRAIQRYLIFLALMVYDSIVIDADTVLACFESLKNVYTGAPILFLARKSIHTGVVLLKKLNARYVASLKEAANGFATNEDRDIFIEQNSIIHDEERIQKQLQGKLKENSIRESNLARKNKLQSSVNGYTPAELEEIIRQNYELTSVYGSDMKVQDKVQISRSLNLNLEFLLGNHLLLRNQNKRTLCMGDLGLQIGLSDGISGASSLDILTFQLFRSKTRDVTAAKSMCAATRHKSTLSYLVGAVAFSSLYKYDMQYSPYDKTDLEDMFTNLDYHSHHLMSINERNSEVSKQYCADLVKSAFARLGKGCPTNITVLARKIGARICDAAGVCRDQIARQG